MTYTLTTTLSGLGYNSVTLLNIWNVIRSSGASGAAPNNVATTNVGFDLFSCFKNGGDVTNTLKQLTCWIVTFGPTTTPGGASDYANKMYDIMVYQYQTATAYNATAHAATNIVWAAGAGNVGGVLKTTDGFGTAAKWTQTAVYTSADVVC
jgi:hypothetical protein